MLGRVALPAVRLVPTLPEHSLLRRQRALLRRQWQGQRQQACRRLRLFGALWSASGDAREFQSLDSFRSVCARHVRLKVYYDPPL